MISAAAPGAGTTTGWWRRAAVVVAAVWALVLAGAHPAGAQDDEESHAGGIVVVGVPGLTWSDITYGETPTLWRLAGDGATASMSVRTIGSWTCPEAAWVTMGAGARAGGLSPRDAHCMAQSRIPTPVVSGGEWSLPWFGELVAANTAYNYGARLGSLADAMRNVGEARAADGEDSAARRSCVAAIGVGAAIAAADTEGTVAFWGADLEALPEAMAACEVVIVDPGVIVGEPGDVDPEVTDTDYDALGTDDTDVTVDSEGDTDEEPVAPDPIRIAAASEADAAVAEITAVMPDKWRLLIAGVADSTAPSELHPVIYAGHGIDAGYLTSATTGRDGYVQLVDLAPTALAAVGADVPAAMSGRPAKAIADPDHDSASAVATGVDETSAATAVAAAMPGFFLTVTVLGILAVAAATWLVTGGARLRRTARFACVAVAALPVAAIAAGIPPWWRAGQPGLAMWGIIAAVALGLALAAQLPWLRVGPRPALLVAAATFGIVAVDQFAASTWPLHTPMGYTAQAGARFSGLGNYSFAAFAAAVILLITLTPWTARARFIGPAAIAFGAIAVVGAPTLGRNVGGTITLVVAVVLACLRLWGRRLSIGALATAGGIAAGVITAAGFLDYLRPDEDQTHLGRFVASVLSGSAGDILARKASSAVSTIWHTPLTFLVLAAAVAAVWIWRTRGPARRDSTAAAALGLAAVAVIGFAVNDSGIAIPAFAICVGFGLLAVAAAEGPDADREARLLRVGADMSPSSAANAERLPRVMRVS